MRMGFRERSKQRWDFHDLRGNASSMAYVHMHDYREPGARLEDRDDVMLGCRGEGWWDQSWAGMGAAGFGATRNGDHEHWRWCQDHREMRHHFT